ncbi:MULTISPECIES: uracil-xanthine permease family protein [Dietzia]|uniref:uracil-xanthine permease family protein n=1 Tax=Dietzia TaxID=37914 RepID=UPI000A031A08|nr:MULTISPECIES: solute carrier family 23 protein [Dietzia]MCT2059818.1 NCS2 family nucleobase:cation symporter [Dietzia cinnamea]MCT2121965.1 NCS2 family nucleobase:cation symporter [Dietzia cinnamea]MCT2146090.1 NCS2 family nucleobase:cation symporter [Dietzia cinnamea]MCT2305409.1 NCS2 family nucleobase:cation symporter [Dietzia cinnamea]
MAMFSWQPTDGHGVVAPKQRLPWPGTIGIGLQHVVAMFGATFLVPVLTGFPPATTLLFSGIGTILFLLITRNQLPSYLGSSFAVIAPVTAAVSSNGPAGALGGIVMVGVLVMIVGAIVNFAGIGWIEKLMPPVCTGAIVALVGFNLAPTAKDNFEESPLTAFIVLVLLVASLVLFRGLLGRLAIFLAVVIGYFVAFARGEVDTSAIAEAAWFGLPDFTTPEFHFSLLPMFIPVVLVLVVENIGHVKSISAMTGTNNDRHMGRALFADGLATTIAGSGGGTATTTYAENIGVMAATKVYSTAAYWVAGLAAVLLGLCPKVGAAIASIPPGVLGGATVALYGLVGILGVHIWVLNRVDFSQPINQFTAAIALVVGIADFTWAIGDLSFGGIALGALSALVVYHAMRIIGTWRKTVEPQPGPAAISHDETEISRSAVSETSTTIGSESADEHAEKSADQQRSGLTTG